MVRWLLASALALSPLAAFAQISAGEAERCFQNPAGCTSAGSQPAPSGGAGAVAPRPAAAPDYTTVLNSPEPDRRKLQESLRTLDKYNGPIDGNLQSEASMKAISEWQKGHGYAQVGKLTPPEPALHPTAQAHARVAEYLAPILSVKVVAGVDEAIAHINRYSSHHTDAILTTDHGHAQRFLREVDSASVMVNTSTRFADGFEYGLGAEIGISTDKFHARGPVGIEGLTSMKWVVLGQGEIRQ